jgi:hypothetical protein
MAVPDSVLNGRIILNWNLKEDWMNLVGGFEHVAEASGSTMIRIF